MGSPGEGSTASSGALQHDSSEFDAELKSSGQVMCVPVGNSLSWYDKADSPTLQTKKAFGGSTGILFLVDTTGFSQLPSGAVYQERPCSLLDQQAFPWLSLLL